MLLATIPITTAVTAATTPQVYVLGGNAAPLSGLFLSSIIQFNFTYGSGGTSGSFYAQTSFDGGVTWCDVANIGVTTASGIKIFNLSASAAAGPLTPTDGSLTANTAVASFMGPIWRIKYTTVGTYAGSTSMRIDLAPRGPVS